MEIVIISQLINKPIKPIGRVCNMICIPIGDTVGKNKNGQDLTMYEVHCQCAWRLIDANRHIIVASSDFYSPPSTIEWTDSFQWDTKGGNLFDEKILLFNSSHNNLQITEVRIEECNDLFIEFNSSIIFEAFTDSSQDENWRVIQRSPQSVHLVSFGNELRNC